LKVESPPDDYLSKLFAQLKYFSQLLEKEDYSFPAMESNDVIQRVLYLMDNNDEGDLISTSLKMLLEFEEQVDVGASLDSTVTDCPEGHINIFSALDWPSSYPTLQTRNFSEFAKPLLDKENVQHIFASYESLAGEKIQISQKIANELLNDLGYATLYPPAVMDDISGVDLAQMVTFIASKIKRVAEASK